MKSILLIISLCLFSSPSFALKNMCKMKKKDLIKGLDSSVKRNIRIYTKKEVNSTSGTTEDVVYIKSSKFIGKSFKLDDIENIQQSYYQYKRSKKDSTKKNEEHINSLSRLLFADTSIKFKGSSKRYNISTLDLIDIMNIGYNSPSAVHLIQEKQSSNSINFSKYAKSLINTSLDSLFQAADNIHKKVNCEKWSSKKVVSTEVGLPEKKQNKSSPNCMLVVIDAFIDCVRGDITYSFDNSTTGKITINTETGVSCSNYSAPNPGEIYLRLDGQDIQINRNTHALVYDINNRAVLMSTPNGNIQCGQTPDLIYKNGFESGNSTNSSSGGSK